MSGTLCQRLLKDGAIYSPVHGDRLSNHLPMSLIALDAMGAAGSQLQNFYDRYIGRLEPIRQHIPPESTPFEETLGHREYFSYHLDYYREEIRRRGMNEALAGHLPLLLPGMSASAFHALIRLSFALEVGSEEEVSHALAFWASDYQYMGGIAGRSEQSPEQIIQVCIPAFETFEFAPGIISDRMNEVAAHSPFKKVNIQPKNLNLSTIARIALEAYLGSDNNFTLLHGVTSCHACRTVLPYLREQHREQAIRYYWQAFVIAFLTTNPKPLKGNDLKGSSDKSSVKGNDWSGIIIKTHDMTDSHSIKLIYSCWQEFKHYGFPEYKLAANVRLKPELND